MSVSLITCTGGRTESFARCRLFMERQTWQGPVQWIIVDDVGDADTRPLRDWEITRICPEPKWQAGQNTYARNMLAAIPMVKHDCILVIEDDDWVSPYYVEQMMVLLAGHEVAGETHHKSYNVPHRRFWVGQNWRNACLCQTGFHAAFLPEVKTVCENIHILSIDNHLWDRVTQLNLSRGLVDSGGCIGIKGMPGRSGISHGHKPEYFADWVRDPELTQLHAWIGDDVTLYTASDFTCGELSGY